MNRLFFLLFLLAITKLATAQKPRVFFTSKVDTIKAELGKIITHELQITAPRQSTFRGYKVEFYLIENDFGISKSKIFFPQKSTLTISGQKDETLKFKIKFKLDQDNDRLIKLKLRAYDTNGNKVVLDDFNLEKQIYIKPTTKSNDRYEFWVFTGTNLDLLDGAKAKELYFKGSYMVNIEKKKRATPHWLYFTFGSNRFFSDQDSLSRIGFSDNLIERSTKDSITLVNGFYNTQRQTEYNKIFITADYLHKIDLFSSKESNFFVNGGLHFGHQTEKISFTKHKILATDTLVIERTDSVLHLRPILDQLNLTTFNTNINIGFLHILSTEKINVKTQLSSGLSFYYNPSFISRNATSEKITLKRNIKPFMLLRIDATVLNPGISLGFEAFIRKNEIPLFNVSLTKVFDIEKLSDLFGKISPAKT